MNRQAFLWAVAVAVLATGVALHLFRPLASIA